MQRVKYFLNICHLNTIYHSYKFHITKLKLIKLIFYKKYSKNINTQSYLLYAYHNACGMLVYFLVIYPTFNKITKTTEILSCFHTKPKARTNIIRGAYAPRCGQSLTVWCSILVRARKIWTKRDRRRRQTTGSTSEGRAKRSEHWDVAFSRHAVVRRSIRPKTIPRYTYA